MRYFFIFFAWSDLESAANKLLGTAKNGRLVVGDLKQSVQLLTVEEASSGEEHDVTQIACFNKPTSFLAPLSIQLFYSLFY